MRYIKQPTILLPQGVPRKIVNIYSNVSTKKDNN